MNPEDTAIDIARQQMFEEMPTWFDLLERAFDCGVEAGITHKSWEDLEYRPALERIRTILDKYAIELTIDGITPIDEIRKLIAFGLSAGPPSEPPPTTLKELREAQGLTIEQVCESAPFSDWTLIKYEYGRARRGTDSLVGSFVGYLAFLYGTTPEVIHAAMEASRIEAGGQDDG